MSPGRARALQWLLLAASSLVSLLVLEVALRAWGRKLAEQPREQGVTLPLLEPNPRGTGSYRMKAGLDLEAPLGTKRIRVRTNSHGMRWREIPVEKPAGRRRIAFLGDSFAFGCWSDSVEDSLVGVFERNVSARLWEALNFGVGGYGPADEELQLGEEVLRFSPDVVVVVFFAGNDFRDAWLGVDKARIVDGTAQLSDANVRALVPASELAEDPTLSRATPAGPLRARLERLATVRFLEPLLGLQELRLEFAVNRNFTMFTYWSQHPYPEAARQARDAALACYARMHDALKQRGIRFGIVAVPYKEQVRSRLLAGRDYDVTLPQAYVEVFARDRGIPYLDLLPVFRGEVEAHDRRLYLDADIHLDQEGHRLAGEAIADWFRCCVK